jgi:hypothetical protein
MRGLLSVVASTVVLVVAAACGGSSTSSSPTSSPSPTSTTTVTATASPSTPVPPHAEGWRRIPDPPTSLGLINVWTGREVLASLEGCCQSMDGPLIYAYGPAKRAWRTLPRYPLGERVGSAFVWTGTELIQVGGRREIPNPGGPWTTREVRNGMALNPETRTWRRIAGAPQAVPTQVVVWTGKEAIFADAESLLRYNPSTDTWSRGRPIPGVDRGLPTVVWTGRELVVWGGSMIVRHGRSDYDMSLRDGYAYRPATDHWRSLPAAPIGAWGAVGAWDGHRVLVWGGEATRNQGRERFVQDQGAAYDPITNAWSGLPQAPIPGTHSWDLTGAWTGRELVVIVTALRHSEHSEGAAYNPNTGRWRALPPGPTSEWLGGVRSVWTDQALVVLPGPFGRQALQYFPGY